MLVKLGSERKLMMHGEDSLYSSPLSFGASFHVGREEGMKH